LKKGENMDEIIGGWKLVDYYFEREGGERFYPWGEKPVGWFILDRDGNMSAQIMHRVRPEMDLPPTVEQASRAYHTYVAYFGKTELDIENRTIRTRVEGALNPEWVGGVQERSFGYQDGRLMLCTPWMRVGKSEVRGVILWEKI